MEKYESLYRKYRPVDFDEVVGQKSALSYLKKVVTEQKPSHAYLFFGGRGIGKTSVARIFAKSLGVSQEDIYELDAASNRGIDEVRELRDSVHTLPFSSPYKVYILDEAHMLTKDASNALLKTLEEPPTHVLFILATTEKQKLLSTIVSRCQLISFEDPDETILSKHLVSVAKKEGYLLSDGASLSIAKEGKGSFRDALGVLEKVLRSSENDIVDEVEVRQVLGFSEKEVIEKILVALFSGDNTSLFESLLRAREKAGSPDTVLNEIIEVCRDLLLLRLGVIRESTTTSTLSSLAKQMEKPVLSKHILFLLEKKALLKKSEDKAWLVLEIILFEMKSSL
jgi:DNA polymerase-3 subunit gamma/tau